MLSYADRARKAVSPSNLAVKALSIVAAHHSNPSIDDWPQVGSTRNSDNPKKIPAIDPAITQQQVDLPFAVSKSVSSPALLQPPHPQDGPYEYTHPGPSWNNVSDNHTPSLPHSHSMDSNQKVIFGSIGLESSSSPPLPPTPTSHAVPEIPTKTPTFSVGLDDSTQPVPARLKSRTRLATGAEETDVSKSSRDTSTLATPTSATTTPNKWKFGTTSSTPVVNGKKPLPDHISQVEGDGGVNAQQKVEQGEAVDPPNNGPSSSVSSSLLFHPPTPTSVSQQSYPDCQPNPDSTHSKARERGISFGYIDTPLPLDENISTPNKSKNKSKTKPKTKVMINANTNTKLSVEVEVKPANPSSNKIDDGNSNYHSNSNSTPNREDGDVDSDTDFKVKDFGFGFGSACFGASVGGGGMVQREEGDGGQSGDGDNETGDKQNVAVTGSGDGHHDQLTQSGLQPRPINPSAGLGPIDNMPQLPPQPLPISSPIHAPSPTNQYPHGPPVHAQPQLHGHLHPRSSRRGNGFGNPIRGGGYGSHNHNHERGGYGSHERGGYERGGRRGGGRGGMNMYSRGYGGGRGYNRGGGGPGPASSHSSPTSGGGQRAPYVDNITSPPALPLHFSQLSHPGMDSMYYPPPRHISSGGPPGGPGPFDPYQPYPHQQQQQPHLQQHLPPHLQGYPHLQQQPPPPLPPHLLASVSTSVSNSSTNTSSGTSPVASSTAASGAGGDDVPSESAATSTSTSPLNAPLSSSSSSSTPPPPSSTSTSSHIPPPVPIPLTILPFPLDSTRYYLLGQLEYYLSPQNMVQDFFLRTQMDSKGYIPISLLASFNRIKQLTLDTRLVREVLLLSAFVEVRGGMVRMGGVGGTSSVGQGGPGGGGQGGNEEQGGQVGWEAFVLPDAVESVVEDVVENVENGGGGYGYHHHNGYGYGSSGYGYGYGSPGYGYGYGYGYPPPSGGPGPGLGYHEDWQSQTQQQQGGGGGGGGYELGVGNEGDDGHGHISSHDQQQQHQQHREAVPSSMINGYSTAGSESTTTTTHNKLDNDPNIPPTSIQPSPIENREENNKPNGTLKHEEEDEYEDDDDDDDDDEVVFVMGTDVGTSWSPERERRA